MQKTPTVKQLNYFLAVVNAGSYRKAAEKLGVSQPTLTTQIATLEETLGLRLLDRSRSGAFTTPVGRDLIAHTRNVLNEMQTLMKAAAVSRDGPGGTHSFGVPPTLGPYLLPYIVPELHHRFPALKLYMREMPPQELEIGLGEGRHDLIMTPLPTGRADLVTEELFSESLKIAVPADHPYAKLTSLQGADLRGQTLLALEEKHHLYGVAKQLAERHGAVLRRDYEGTSLDTLRQMVGMGMGLAFLPALYISSEIDGRGDEVVTLPFAEGGLTRTVALAWRPQSPGGLLYREFGAIIRDICRHKLSHVVEVAEFDRDLKAAAE